MSADFTEILASGSDLTPSEQAVEVTAQSRSRLAWLRADRWLKKGRPDEPPVPIELSTENGSEPSVGVLGRRSISCRLGLASRQTRVGIAALLSLGILAGFWATNKLRHPTARPTSAKVGAGTELEAGSKPPDAEAVTPLGPAVPASVVREKSKSELAQSSPVMTVAAEVPQSRGSDEAIAPAIPVIETEEPARSQFGPAISPLVTARPVDKPPLEPDPASVPPLPPGIDAGVLSPPGLVTEAAPPVPIAAPEPTTGLPLPTLAGESASSPVLPVAEAVPPIPATASNPTPHPAQFEPFGSTTTVPRAAQFETVSTVPVANAERSPRTSAALTEPDTSIKPAPSTFGALPDPAPPPMSSFAPASLPSMSAATGDRIPLPNAGKALLDIERPIGPEPPRRVLIPVSPRNTAAVQPAPPPARGQEVFATHIVQSGENFWTISRLYYGKGRYYKALWKANEDRVVAPDQLVVGMTLRIPPPEGLDLSLIEPAGSETIPALATGDRTAAPARRDERTALARKQGDSLIMLPASREHLSAASNEPIEPEKPRPFHVARQYETLRSIARDRLGDAHRADEIFDMNQDVITDSNRLTQGTRLRLPSDAERVRR